jgi:hypothetical protein
MSTLLSWGISYLKTPGVLFRIEPTLDLPPQVEHSGMVTRIDRSAAAARSPRLGDNKKPVVSNNKNTLFFRILPSG